MTEPGTTEAAGPSLRARCHPLAEAVEEHTWAWLNEHRLLDGHPAVARRLRASRFGIAMAHLYPDARQDVLELIVDTFEWLTALDDIHVEADGATTATLAPQIASFVGVLDVGVPSGPGVFASALGELADRMRTVLTPGQAACVRARLRDMFLAMLWESSTRDRVIGFAEYQAMRRHTAGGYLAAAFIEPGAGFDLPAAVREDPGVRRLHCHLALLVGWLNDLHSFDREQQLDGAHPSLLAVLARERGCTPEEALSEARRLCDREAAAADRLLAQLGTSLVPRAHLAAIADALGSVQQTYTIVAERYTT